MSRPLPARGDGTTPRTLTIEDQNAHRAFRASLREAGFNPDSRWDGQYVDYQWARSRHVFEALPEPLAGKRVLEFGFNLGASSIVLASLGATVIGVDVTDAYIDIARLNVRRYGKDDSVELQYVPNSAHLPFPDNSFEVVTCVSVLEYVPAGELSAIQREIDRVLAPGGLIVITGTSNWLWPREQHSGRWFRHYWPGSAAQCVSPWRVRRGFGKHYVNLDRADRGKAYLQARNAMRPGRLRSIALGAANAVAQALGTSPGLWAPSIAITLRKS